jgi:hypothetical protein
MFNRMKLLSKMWQEEEDDDGKFFGDDDENIILSYEYLQQQAFGWRRRSRNLDAPPRWPNKRDHSTDDAQIRVDCFSPNPVYSPMHFRKRYVLKLHNIYDMAISQQRMTQFVVAGFVCVRISS